MSATAIDDLIAETPRGIAFKSGIGILLLVATLLLVGLMAVAETAVRVGDCPVSVQVESGSC